MNQAKKIGGALLIIAGLLLGGYALWDDALRTEPTLPPPEVAEPAPTQTPEPSPVPSPEPTVSPESAGEPALTGDPEPDVEPDPDEKPSTGTVGQIPIGKLVVTKERKSYKDGNLTIHIPVISITRTIYNGTDAATLNKGVGLYEYAQLPGEGNRNVSLAGHRNGLSNGVVTDKAPFFYIDRLQEGDYLYVYDSENIYRYVWEYSEIVKPDDWDPIRTTDYSCLTITSCHPIGISDHRIVVRGKLDEIIPYDKDYAFPASIEEVLE